MFGLASTADNNTVTVYVSGRIDSTNSAEFEQRITEADTLQGLIIDLKDLEYISSAGLRVFLRLRKKHPDLRLHNAETEVYEILDMTGFTQMLKVTRAYRTVSVEGCDVIGRGANGVIYRLDPDTIVKVYLHDDSLADIEREREVAKKALLLGIPTAISYDVVEADGHYASMFEMLNGDTIANRLAADPSVLEGDAKLYSDLLKLIHSTEVPAGQLPDQLTVVGNWVQSLENALPEDIYRKIKTMVGEIPHDDHMIHGDYHVKNVMIQNGEALLIDMDTLSVGHPILEMANIWNAYRGFYSLNTADCRDFLGIDYSLADRFYRKAIEFYYDTEDWDYLNAAILKPKLVGLIHLLSHYIRTKAPEETISFYRDALIQTAEQVDSLL